MGREGGDRKFWIGTALWAGALTIGAGIGKEAMVTGINRAITNNPSGALKGLSELSTQIGRGSPLPPLCPVGDLIKYSECLSDFVRNRVDHISNISKIPENVLNNIHDLGLLAQTVILHPETWSSMPPEFWIGASMIAVPSIFLARKVVRKALLLDS